MAWHRPSPGRRRYPACTFKAILPDGFKHGSMLINAFIFLCLFTLHPTASPAEPINPRQLLQKHYQAIGGLARLKAIRTVYTEGTTQYDGLKGTFRLWEQSPLQYRLEEDFSVIRQVRGDSGQSAWRKDPNGKVVLLRDEETRKRREIARRYEAFEHLDPDSSFFRVSYEGMESIDSRDCFAVTIGNRLNRDVLWYFIDRHSFLLVKSIDQQPDFAIHTRYSDYRDVDGILSPFHDESDIIPRQKKEVNQVEKRQYNLSIRPSRFHIPPDSPPDYSFHKGDRAENIPLRFIENLLYIEVTTAGRKGLWLIDSGASMSIIDQEYAEGMGLTPKGSIKGFGFGRNFELQFVSLPAFQLPGVTFQEQTIFSYQGLSEQFSEPMCYGILGFDFLSRFVVKIDYASRKLSLFSPSSFIYRGDGVPVDAPLKDGTFTFTATVDNRYTGQWSLDLGSFNTSFHFPFAQAHELFQRPGVYRFSRGLGGAYMEKTIRFQTIQVGPHVIQCPQITIPEQKGTGATASSERIGNIGNSILRRFSIYLDYGNQQLIFEKGADFHTFFPEDHSGLQIGRSESGAVQIVFVSPESPGQRAGFMAGDRLTQINQMNITKSSDLLTVKKIFRRKPGTVLQVEILRNNEKKRLPLTLEKLPWNSPCPRS